MPGPWESFLRCQFAGIHGRGERCISAFRTAGEGEVVGCYSIDSINSIQSGCNYQYATATHQDHPHLTFNAI